MSVSMCVNVHTLVYVQKTKDSLQDLVHDLLLHGSWSSNRLFQAWQQAPLWAEPSPLAHLFPLIRFRTPADGMVPPTFAWGFSLQLT